MKETKLKLKLITLPILLLLLAGTFGLAVPSINVNVQEIGAGSQRLVSPVLQGSIWFSTGLTSGELVFSEDLPAGTQIYVSLRDANNNTVAYNYSIVLTSDLTAGSVLNYSLINPNGASRADVVRAVVTVMTPNYQTTFTSGNILVTSRELGVGIANTTVFCIPITVKENSGQTLYNYSVLVVLDDSANSNSENWSVDWNVINATNLYFTDDDGNPLYFWVQYLDTNNRIAYLWVKLPELDAGASRTICLTYGVWPNPYVSYNDPDNVFLLFDDFEGSSLNTEKWNVHGDPVVSNSVLSLSSGQWIWSKKEMPSDSFQILIQSSRLRASPFFMWYIDNRSLAWAEVFNGSSWSATDELWVFNVSSGKWGVSYSGGGSPVLWSNNLINITVLPYNLTHVVVFIYEDSSLISYYILPKEPPEPVGIGQWYYYNWRGIPRSRTSSYDWILVRRYVYPEPSVSVGYLYYKLVFHPQPPATATASSSVTTSPAGALAPLSIPGLNDALLAGKSVPLRFPISPEVPSNNTPLIRVGNGTEERIKNLVSNLTPVADGP
ncbi:hypothetical protein CL1_1794 [Thermococcus cleftensis]|uniref:DUF2341 domain-containing protein n=1 Tax=Thermococcus cleftensis (strain DSM 27260 / KACC 17922 / CL1) TaxID=163003 RepID=I3ZWA6_THECF|nr:DUF2341 domain-containing protein [Thermococcus cleftensis]AFL95990.1 hypothetical protein CL1_1794 [Thermococcus cleftensis]